MRKFTKVLACIALAMSCANGADTEVDAVFVEVLKTDVEKQPELTMVLRLPKDAGPKSPPVGLLAFCTWQNEPASLRKAVMDDANPPVTWALKNGFAVITWNTARVWVGGTSHADLDRRTDKLLDAEFDRIAKAWEYGLLRFSRKLDVPAENILLYGISGGAHWAHRLALRKPSRFLAVHIHVANSYDRPTPQAARLLWLVSSGDLDYGNTASHAFYRQCLAENYPILLKTKRSLGHHDHPAIVALRNTFALDLLNNSTSPELDPWVLEKMAIYDECGNFIGYGS